MKSVHFAPVQGHTDAPYRHFHNLIYGTSSKFYTPFIRLENDSIRQRDLKDLLSPLNDNTSIIPQIIFRDKEELNVLVEKLKKEKISRIDLNMGCPFPLQTGHGRGAATIANHQLAESVAELIKKNPDISFSVKMRLGLSQPDEWKSLLPLLNKVNVSHITVHPRIARQQYSGDLFLDQFEQILEQSLNPVIFNGDIRKPSDIDLIFSKFPTVAGIMSGRGVLGRPSLLSEWKEGSEWTHDKRIEKMLLFHRRLLDYYTENLCGESQIISKIKPFWEYAEEEIGRKSWKSIKKATNIAKYHSAVASIK